MSEMRKLEETEIQDAALQLASLIRYNDEVLKPEKRIVHTATAVVDGTMVVAVNGSAHQLEPLFEKLIRQRPELRQVMESALMNYYQPGK